MPRVNLYIRTEDADKWLAIENKSEFVHNALNGKPSEVEIIRSPKRTKLKVIKTKEDAEETVKLLGECPRHHVDRSVCGD